MILLRKSAPIHLFISKLSSSIFLKWNIPSSKPHTKLAKVSPFTHALTRHLNANADHLYNDYGILYENRRTCNGRIVTLKLKL